MGDAAEAFLTVGELRRRLAEQGHPWTVDPRLADGDPIPQYGKGGQPLGEWPNVVAPFRGDLNAELRAQPPTNPLLRARWVELGLLQEP